MSVRKRNGRWEIRLRVGGGRRIERTLPPGGTRADALAIESEIRRAQLDAAAGRRRDPGLTELLDRWVAEEASKQSSWCVTKYKVGVLREYVSGRKLSESLDVASQLKRVDARPATINRYLKISRPSETDPAPQRQDPPVSDRIPPRLGAIWGLERWDR